jgi:hypothetical protein
MSSTAFADITASEKGGNTKVEDHQPDVIESNHILPARRVIEGEEQTTSNMPEDAETTAASEELRHTSISDKHMPETLAGKSLVDVEVTSEDKDMKDAAKISTPEADTADLQDEEMRERVGSPKKKRGRDQDDDAKDLEDSPASASGSAEGAIVNGSRTERLAPEKKRPRDTSDDHSKLVGEDIKVGTHPILPVFPVLLNYSVGHSEYGL